MDEKKFKNALEVTAFLQEQGWKVKKSSLYRHIKEGKLRTASDGNFIENAVLKYAKLFLKRLDGTTLRRGERAQQCRTEAESRKLAAQARHWEMKAAILEGSHVLRSEFETALAKRASIFRNDLESFAYWTAPEIVQRLKSDTSKVPDLIQFLMDKIAGVLDRYADPEGVKPLPPPNYETAESLTMEEDEDFD